MDIQNLVRRLWMLLVFEFFPVVSKSPPVLRHSTNSPSATFVSATILVCKDVDIFMKRMTSLKLVLR